MFSGSRLTFLWTLPRPFWYNSCKNGCSTEFDSLQRIIYLVQSTILRAMPVFQEAAIKSHGAASAAFLHRGSDTMMSPVNTHRSQESRSMQREIPFPTFVSCHHKQVVGDLHLFNVLIDELSSSTVSDLRMEVHLNSKPRDSHFYSFRPGVEFSFGLYIVAI